MYLLEIILWVYWIINRKMVHVNQVKAYFWLQIVFRFIQRLCIFISQKLLNQKFGLIVTVNKTGVKDQWRLNVWKRSMPLLAELVGPYIIPSLTLLTKLPGESCLTPPPPHPYPFGEGRRRGRQHPFIMGFFPPPPYQESKGNFPLTPSPYPKGEGWEGWRG